MTSDQYAKCKQIFLEACAQPDEHRSSFVSAACGGDEVLLHEVGRLLSHHLPSIAPVSADTFANRVGAKDHPKDLSELPTFQTGDMIANRYRIVSLLGEGGMGKVYRAEDGRLNQPVALKFLPKLHVIDPTWRRRVESEVRLAREVAHPNICRVYDLRDIDGAPFISMEYIDGENLSSLLRRVGRLTGVRAIDMARQLCAGLAAAHIHGVLHRDLKPANVMIDQKGRIRITDFGLAVLSGHVERREIRAGTPRYMAPEQLAGVAVNEKSDIYSLGLVLYEMFTGQPAFDADNVAEYLNIHLNVEPKPPSDIVPEIDPKLEAVILACLHKDPDERPESALNVAAALPGGDLLAAAMDAGQIPTREMLATAAAQGAINRRGMFLVAAAALALFVLAICLGRNTHPVAVQGGVKSPEVLFEKSCEIVRLAGYDPTPNSSVGRYLSESAAAHRVTLPTISREKSSLALPSDVKLLYCFHVNPPGAALFQSDILTFIMPGSNPSGIESRLDPSTTIILDGNGRLLSFDTLPQLELDSPIASSAPDWQPLAIAAGYNPADFVRSQLLSSPAAVSDEFMVFHQALSASTSQGVRLEIEKYRNCIFRFAVTRDSSAPPKSNWTSFDSVWTSMRSLRNGVMLLLLAAALPGAWKNLKNRGDLVGAVRLGAFVSALRLFGNLLSSHGTGVFSDAINALANVAVSALCEGLIVALFYLALESHIRRLWPRTLGCWSRLLNGRFRDPFVGRDMLVGCLVGVIWAIFAVIDRRLSAGMGWESRPQLWVDQGFEDLMGARFAFAGLLGSWRTGIYQGLVMLFILVIATRLAGTRRWPAIIMAWLMGAAMYAPIASHPLTAWTLFAFGIVGVGLYLLINWGLVSLVTAILIAVLLSVFPISTDFNVWYAGYGIFAGVATTGLVLWSLYEATRHPVFDAANSRMADRSRIS